MAVINYAGVVWVDVNSNLGEDTDPELVVDILKQIEIEIGDGQSDFAVVSTPVNRGGWVCLNSFRPADKWIPASIKLPSGLMAAR